MTRSEMTIFARIGKTNRSIDRHIRDVAGLSDALKDESVNGSKFALMGVRHAMDESMLLLALRAARDEIDLEMKSAILVGATPMIAGNSNLTAMIEAALIADVQRIKPARLPIELRKIFRN